MHQKVDYPAKPCEYCNQLFKPKTKSTKWCSQKCRKKKRIRKSRAGLPIPRKYGPYVCRGCGKEYLAKASDRNKYCSRDCGLKATTNKPKLICELPKYSRVYESTCINCGVVYIGRLRKNYCDIDCYKKYARKTYSTTHGLKLQRTYATRDCLCCGVQFSRLYGNKSKTCSIECSKELKRRSGGNYRNTHRQRARHFGVEYEPVNALRVLDRDGWTCQLCGASTPKTLRGTLDDNAPELDHIIPLSKGGPHSYNNVQCACRTCNILKGNMSNEEYIYRNLQDTRGMSIPAALRL